MRLVTTADEREAVLALSTRMDAGLGVPRDMAVHARIFNPWSRFLSFDRPLWTEVLGADDPAFADEDFGSRSLRELYAAAGPEFEPPMEAGPAPGVQETLLESLTGLADREHDDSYSLWWLGRGGAEVGSPHDHPVLELDCGIEHKYEAVRGPAAQLDAFLAPSLDRPVPTIRWFPEWVFAADGSWYLYWDLDLPWGVLGLTAEKADRLDPGDLEIVPFRPRAGEVGVRATARWTDAGPGATW